MTLKVRAWVWVVTVVVLALVSNLVFVALTSGQGKGSVFAELVPLPSDKLLAVVALEGERVALLTLDNDLILVEGERELGRVTVPTTAAGLVYLPAQHKLLVGAADGSVYAYGLDLKPLGQTDLAKGLVKGLAAMPDGKVAVGTGIGAYGDKFYLSILDAQQRVLGTYQVGRFIASIGVLNDLALAGDENAWVTAVSPDGQLRWQTQLERNVTVLYGDHKAKRLYAGDIAGTAYLLDEDGQVVWQVNLSQWKIEAIYAAGDLVLVGDTEGGLYLLDRGGQVLLTSPMTRERVTAFYPGGEDTVIALYRSGKRLQINPRALRGAQRTQMLRPIWYGANALWLLLLLAALTYALESWRRAFYHVRQQVKRSLLGYAFLLPTALAILVFTYLPAAMAIYYSMTDFIPGKPSRFIGLTNFVTIFTKDKYFWVGMGNMLLILATSTLKVLTMPLLVALLIFHLRSGKWQYIFRTAFIVPTVVPGIVSTLMWKMMYSPGDAGFFNNLLVLLGRPEWQRAWLGDERTAIWAIIFAGFPWVGAFALLIYLGGLININPELIDAAAIDGVNAWQRLRYLEWPLLAPQRNLLLFFTYLGAIQGYTSIYVFTEGGPGYATYVPALQMFLRLARGMEVGYASAIGFVLLLMVLTVTIIKRRFESREVAV